MTNQPDISIDRQLLKHLDATVITLNRSDKPELGKNQFKISNQLLAVCYRELGITTDYGGMERMKEVVHWLCKHQPREEIIADVEIIE